LHFSSDDIAKFSWNITRKILPERSSVTIDRVYPACKIFLIRRLWDEERTANIVRFYGERWKYSASRMTHAWAHERSNHWMHFEIDDNLSRKLSGKTQRNQCLSPTHSASTERRCLSPSQRQIGQLKVLPRPFPSSIPDLRSWSIPFQPYQIIPPIIRT
jgi:hypothetical protein